MDSITLHVIAVIFLATLIRSAFGFGEALIALPLLSLPIPVNMAAPLAVLISIIVAGVVVAQDWRHVHVRSAGGLVLASIAGIPLGLWLLKSADERVIKSILGGVIIAFSCYALFTRSLLHLERDHTPLLLVCGFFAGILGGAYGMNGPPLVVYGSLRQWSPQHFRSTLQAYFLPASLIGMAGYYLAGLWTTGVTHYFLISLPVTVLAIFAGRWLNRRMGDRSFLKYVYVGLIAIGATLIVQSMRK